MDLFIPICIDCSSPIGIDCSSPCTGCSSPHAPYFLSPARIDCSSPPHTDMLFPPPYLHRWRPKVRLYPACCRESATTCASALRTRRPGLDGSSRCGSEKKGAGGGESLG
eukprot:scaffold19537_cov77-Isochrysis_galbana.AAC.3